MKINAVKVISFLLILVMLLLTVQAVMTPKWHFDPERTGRDTEGDTDRYGVFYELPKNTVDYVTIGASTSYYSINPTRIYGETGIVGYCIGHSSMRKDLAYFILKEMLKTQHPQVVFFDASLLVKGQSHAPSMTKAFCQMSPSLNKLEAALACQTEDVSATELLFPLIQFHERWKSLSREDFTFGPAPDYAQSGSHSLFITEMHTDILDRPYGNVYTLKDGKMTGGGVAFEQISETNAAYFEKILALCRENGMELVPTHFCTIWPQGRDELVSDYLEPFGLELLDMTDPAVGLDWSQDTLDSGRHTNFWGNAKGSVYLADCLQAMGLEDHRGQSGYELWDQTLETYLQWEQERLASIELVSAYDYLNALASVKDEYLIVLTVANDASAAWNDALKTAMRRLGVKSSFFGQTQRSFAAILDQGETLFEHWDGREIDVDTTFQTADGKEHTLYVVSGGFAYGNIGSVSVDGAEQAVGAQGLNIVVIDRTSGETVSSVCIDSGTEGMPLSVRRQTDQWREIEESYQLIEDGIYNIIPAADDTCAADVSGGSAKEGADIRLRERSGRQSQAFAFTFLGDGLYTIRAAGSDKYLSIKGMGSTSGSGVILQTYTGLADQKWFVTENDDGSYSFRSLYNGCMLDVTNSIAAPGASVQVCEEDFLEPQQFALERIGGIEG